MTEEKSQQGIWKFVFITAMIAIIIIAGGWFIVSRLLQQHTIIDSSDVNSQFFAENFPLPRKSPEQNAHIFYTLDGVHLMPQVVKLDENLGNYQKAQLILKHQLAPGPEEHLVNPIPRGTQLISLFLIENRIVINLSQQFEVNMPAGATSEILAAYALVNAMLLNIEGFDSVEILIEGAPSEILELDYSIPFVEDESLIRWN